MILRPVLFVLLFFVYCLSSGQQQRIDSLKTRIANTTEEVVKLKLLDSISYELINYGDDQAEEIKYFHEYFDLATKQNNTSFQAQALRNIAIYHQKEENFEKALNFINQSLTLSIDNDDKRNIIYNYIQLGRIFNHFDSYPKAIINYKKALAFYDKLDKKQKKEHERFLNLIYANLGVAYKNNRQDKLADDCFLKSSILADTSKDYMRKSNFYATIAWTYVYLEDYAQAEKYFKLGIKDSAKIKLKIYIIAIHHGLGVVYSRWGKYNKAFKHDSIALAFFKRTKNKTYEHAVLNNMANLYINTKNYKKALALNIESLKIIKDIANKTSLIDSKITQALIYLKTDNQNKGRQILQDILKIYKEDKNFKSRQKIQIYKQLFELAQQAKKYKKSNYYLQLLQEQKEIKHKQQLRNSAMIEDKYLAEKIEKENLQLKTENTAQELVLEKQHTLNLYFEVGLLFTVFILIIFTYLYYKSSKQKKHVESLQRELHHRMKSNLSIINTFVDEVKDNCDNKAIIYKLDNLQNRVDSMTEVHKQLYLDTNLTKLKLKVYIDKLVCNIEETFNNKNIKVLVNISQNTIVPVKKSFPIGLIVNEFVTNSFKYAFKEKKSGTIQITLKEEPQNFVLKLQDNGTGLDKNINISTLNTYGLEMMQLLSRQLKGTFKLSNDSGLKITIQIPKY
jgi:two-component sensor histidine kinase